MMKTIRGKLIATISVVCAIVISFVIFISAYVSENIVMDKSKQQMTLLAEKYSSQVEGWLDKQVTNTESLAVFVEVNKKTDLESLRKAVLSLFQFQSDEILEIYYGMEDKTIVMGSGGALPDGYDCTVRGWYTAAKTAGKTIITDPYVDAFTGKMIVSVAVPIYIDGKFAGAAGNLTVPVHPRSDQDAMGTALSRLVVDNNRILINIMTVSNLVGRGAKEVEKGSQDLAQGTTEQASAIEQITASIVEIANQTKKNSEDANEARNLVSKTKSSAQQSGTQMQDMIEAMNAINSSSENISTIIKAIDSIAFETNILALNAAVEAARAGEHGKGFAVVADEVRNLANKMLTSSRT